MKKYNMMTGSFGMQAVGMGLLVAVVVMVLLIVISTVCISNEYFDLELSWAPAIVIQYFACLIGTVVSGKSAKEDRSKAVLLTALMLIVLEFCMALVLFEGIAVSFLYLFLATVTAAMCSMLLCRTKRNRGKSRFRLK